MTKALGLLLLVLTTFVSAITVVSNTIGIANHGGFGLTVNVGVDQGDTILFDVTCDHDIVGQCLVSAPKLASGPVFKQLKNDFRHQKYQLTVPAQGNQFVTAQYWWVGTNVHYYIQISAIEKIGKNRVGH